MAGKPTKRTREPKAEKGKGRRPTNIEMGKCGIRPSPDGTKLVAEGISKAQQDKLIEAIKSVLS